MSTRNSEQPANSDVRYEADEKPPPALAFGLCLQLAVLCVAGVVLTPAIVVRAAGGSEAYLSWAVFAAIAICGATTILQAVRVGRFGAGYVLLMGTSGAFIAVCIAALAQGGPAMLATMVFISSLFQFALSERLSLFRRVLTPTVAGTVIMLIAVTVMPIVFNMLKEAPKGAPALAAPLSALVTVLAIVGIALKVTGALRLWAPVVGVVAGSLVAGYFGIYDTSLVAGAAWIGLPVGEWPGMVLGFGPVFWTLLPGFVFVTLIGAIETVGDAAAIQRVSWRRPRAVDFRAVQGAVAADGVGNLLSGLLATVPNTTYSTSVSVTELTGVGAVLEFVAASGEENLQDRIALLGEQTAGAPLEREVSLRLLRHLASSVHHQQYHDTDIVPLRVENRQRRAAAGVKPRGRGRPLPGKPCLLQRTWWSMPRKALMKPVTRFSSKASKASILPQAVSAILCFMAG